MPFARIAARLRKGRARGFTLIELIVAMAIVAILAAVGISICSGQIAQAHTHSMIQVMDELKTGIAAFQGYNPTGLYPEKGKPASDTVNADNAANAGSASYNALVADLATVGVTNLPPYANVFASWTYQRADTTTPPTYTLTATAAGGTNDVICLDPVNGVVTWERAGPRRRPASRASSARSSSPRTRRRAG